MANRLRPKILLRYGRINQPIRVPIYDLLVDPLAETLLTENIAAGNMTITVKNIAGFDVDQILLIGVEGNQATEIVKTSPTIDPIGSTITLSTATRFPHSVSTSVRVISYDQIELSSAATTTGTKSVIATLDIVADQLETDYIDDSVSSGFYFARFKSSITTNFSAYSDAAPLSGYTILSARSIIDNALEMINREEATKVLTDEYGFKQINNCQMEVLRELKRWSFMQSFDTIIGNTSTGNWHIALPADCDDQNTNKSIYIFHIGKEEEMIWVDKETFDAMTQGFAHSTLATAIVAGAIAIILTDSSDFFDTGALTIGANTYTYTANNRTTNTLAIAASATTNTVGEDAFQNVGFGNPTWYTIYGNTIYHWPPTSSVYNARNYYLDYYKILININKDSDETVLPDPTLVQYYLAWKFLLRLNNGETNDSCTNFLNLYLARRDKLKQKEVMNREFILNPNIE